jgi:glycerol-3-phosphate dehydrogenase
VVVSGDFLPKNDVLILPSIEGDGRFIWCVPWEDNLNVIGTTDTNFDGDKDGLYVTKDEVKYLLDAVNKYLQGSPITEDDILSVYAGLRPLLDDADAEDSTERSRDFEIWWSNDNLATIAGGKLTSFLQMAEKVVLSIEDTHPEMFSDYPVKTKENILKVPAYPMYQQLRRSYGDNNTLKIKDIIDEDESLGYRFDIKYKYLKAEIVFFIRHQSAVTLDDVLTRRTLISYNMKDWDEKLINNVCDLFQQELHWTDSEKVLQVSRYRKTWEIMHTWR